MIKLYRFLIEKSKIIFLKKYPSHFRKDIFFPMSIYPPKLEKEDFSTMVIVFDESDSTYYCLGYYDYKYNQWKTLEDEPMSLKCWCYVPDPSKYWNEPYFEIVHCS